MIKFRFYTAEKNGNLDLLTFFQQYASKARTKGEKLFPEVSLPSQNSRISY